MAREFSMSVQEGLKLSTRLYSEKDRAAISAPKTVASMERSSGDQYLPESPMIYAVIRDPSIVDNPDIPSYQPYVYGRRDPPALIPLYMNQAELHVDTFLDSATVYFEGSWRVHCVMGNKSCDCRLAIPMGIHGSILSVEIDIGRKYFYTEIFDPKEDKETNPVKELAHGAGFLKPHIFVLTIPKVSGGSNLSIKASWVQKLQYNNEEYSLSVPFNFPEYVTPSVKKLAKKEKITLNVHFDAGINIRWNSGSHPMKERKREAGKISFAYEADVLTWTSNDFDFSYEVAPPRISGGAVMQASSTDGGDELRNFCIYLFPGEQKRSDVFKRKVVFLIDTTKSMHGIPLEATKSAVSEAIGNLDSSDAFNIIAFHRETVSFSQSLAPATVANVDKAIQWMNSKLIAGTETDILHPLTLAMQMLSQPNGSLPIIFLVTDGSVENEKPICDFVKTQLQNHASKVKPRIYTFGIGSYCNHYFLKSLAMMSKGQHEAAYEIDTISTRMRKHLNTALSTLVVNLSTDFQSVEIFPSKMTDLTSHSTSIISGRFRGKLPEIIHVSGILPGLAKFSLEIKPHSSKDDDLFKILAKQEIDAMTTEAWLSGDDNMIKKVVQRSIDSKIPSEYTALEFMGGDRGGVKTSKVPVSLYSTSFKSKSKKIESQAPTRLYKQMIAVGFGNVAATAENTPPEFEEARLPETADLIIKATTQCCSNLCNRCCCMCCISCCDSMNKDVANVLAQCCMALTWLGCFECCSMLCSAGRDNS